MLNHPPLDPKNPLLNKNTLDLEFIQFHQKKDKELNKALKNDDSFQLNKVGNINLIQYAKDRAEKPKIVLPYAIQYSAIRWMHSLLGHAGISRLSATLKQHFRFPHMIKSITDFVKKCEYCQRYNK